MKTKKRLCCFLFALLAAALLFALPAGAQSGDGDVAYQYSEDLPTPQNLTAAPYGLNGIRLSWTASAGATHYIVYRFNFKADEWEEIGKAYKAAYYDGGLSGGTTYYYMIAAAADAGDSVYMSAYTDYVGAKTEGAPVAPQNVKAAAYGQNGIRLSWDVSSGSTQYNVYRYNGAKKAYVYIGTAYKAAYYDGGRAPGVTYYYKINAVRKTDDATYVSKLCASVSATAVGTPTVPQGVKAAAYGKNGIRLSWTASPGATQYNIYRYNGAKKTYVYIGTAYKAAYYDGKRAAGVTYYYRINAVCKTKYSTWVSELCASVSAMAVGTPTVPQNVKAAAYGKNGIRLTWTASPGATQYNIYRYNGAKKAYVYIGTSYKAAYYNGSLTPGVTYYYRVTAVCKANGKTYVSGYSAAASRLFAGAPAVPQNVKAAPYGDYGIRLTWTASPGATQYNIYRYNGAKKAYVYIGTAYKAAYYDGSRTAGVTYYYRVRAVYKAGGAAHASGFSAAASAAPNGFNVFEPIPTDFTFASGAGAWATELKVYSDGSFEGEYYDTDTIRGPGYNAITYFCNFSGKFTDVKRIDKYTYSMRVEYLTMEDVPGETDYIEYDMRYISSNPAGFNDAGVFMLYLPGKPAASIPQPVFDWEVLLRISNDRLLENYCLYNYNAGYPFFGIK